VSFDRIQPEGVVPDGITPFAYQRQKVSDGGPGLEINSLTYVVAPSRTFPPPK